MPGEIRLAHLSDWHATTLAGGGSALWRGKRLSGFASWALNRRRHHDPAILQAAIDDVHAQGVDLSLVTGDLTHVSLESEFRVAAGQLARLGSPDRVFLIPGNHDCYVPVDAAASWDHWAPFLAGTPPGDLPPELASLLVGPRAPGRAPRYEDFPTLRVQGRLAAVGVCSAIPTPVFRAGGEIGETQRQRLEATLDALGRAGFFRVVMIHHPVAAHGEPARRALWDGEAFRALLARAGAELVLHGHKHRRRLARLDGPNGPIPAIGVPSASEVGSRPDKPAQYHLYTVREADGGYAIEAEIRGWDATLGAFRRVEETLIEPAPDRTSVAGGLSSPSG